MAQQSGPQLDALLHRLAECPSDFLLPELDLVALACDHLRGLELPIPGPAERKRLAALTAETRRLAALALWLLRDDWFVAQPELGQATWRFLHADALSRLAELVRAEAFVQDPDRREELVRLCLKALELRPKGETVAQAEDRLRTLDSVEREQVIRRTRKAEARAREVREAMAKQRAAEAAARYSRE